MYNFIVISKYLLGKRACSQSSVVVMLLHTRVLFIVRRLNGEGKKNWIFTIHSDSHNIINSFETILISRNSNLIVFISLLRSNYSIGFNYLSIVNFHDIPPADGIFPFDYQASYYITVLFLVVVVVFRLDRFSNPRVPSIESVKHQ